MTPARLAAGRVLMAVARDGATLASQLDEARGGIDDRRDRALAGELAAGTLRWQKALDAWISHAAQRAASSLDLPILITLRLAAYQIHHLDRVPVHAVVHESVDLVRALGAPRAAGLVNAVARRLAREASESHLPRRPAADASRAAQLSYLSTTLSHPAWLVGRWLDRYGFEATEAWCRFNNQPPDVTIRSIGRLTYAELTSRLTAEEIPWTPAPFVDDAIRLPPGALGRLSAALTAEIYVQDEGAQIIARLANAAPGERVLDACAAPGGKTLVMATDMTRLLRQGFGGQGETSACADRRPGTLLVAADRRPARVALLSTIVARANHPAVVVALDVAASLPFGPIFDGVLLDAPCSGLGTLRRDPDLKWTRQASDLPAFAAAESRMLAVAADAVRPGGRLVYATCSSEPDENTAVVDAFLAARSDFARLPASAPRPRVSPSLLDADGAVITSPPVHGLDAYFGVVLVRRPAA
jgi:16S rRNA (cytosine967-C5)-methyltransferase